MNVSEMQDWCVRRLAELPTSSSLLLKLTIVLIASWVVHALLAKTNPRWRVLIWRSTSLALVGTATLHVFLPAFEFPISTLRPLHSNRAVFFSSLEAASLSDRLSIASSTHELPAVAPSPANTDEFQFASVVTSIWNDTPVLFLIWLGGFLVCLGRLRIGARRIDEIVRDSTSPSVKCRTAFEEVERALAAKTAVDLRVSSRLVSPALCGILRPTLLLPAHMDTDGRVGQLPAVFAHELSHARARDMQWNFLLCATSAALWFHPLAWRIRASHAAACELVSDAVAAAYLGDAQAYGKTLVQVALEADEALTLSLAMAKSSDVRVRVERITQRVYRQPLRWPLVLIVLCLGTGITLGLGAVRIVVAQTPTVTVAPPIVDGEDDQQDPTNAVPSKQDAAIAAALQYLTTQQDEQGAFASQAQPFFHLAITSICGRAFHAAERSNLEYGRQRRLAASYVLRHVQPNGLIATKPDRGMMYVHAYCLLFLAEVQLAEPNDVLGKAIASAATFSVDSQNEIGGWRYSPNSKDADSSATACQLLALQRARQAGAPIPKAALDRAVAYLEKCANEDGSFNYTTHSIMQGALPRSAATIAAIAAVDPKDAVIDRGLAYLHKHSRTPRLSQPHFFYAQFHLPAALRHGDAQSYAEWYVVNRDYLIQQQAQDGSWKSELSKEYGTACCCLALLAQPAGGVNHSVVSPPITASEQGQSND